MKRDAKLNFRASVSKGSALSSSHTSPPLIAGTGTPISLVKHATTPGTDAGSWTRYTDSRLKQFTMR
jgi:hypothetical protein